MRFRWRAAVGLGLVASTMFLAGCAATATPVPPGLTDPQLAAVSKAASDARWKDLRLPDYVPEPDVQIISYTSGDTWSITQVQCLDAAGLAARQVSGGFAVDGYAAGDPMGPSPYAVTIAMWTCQAQFPRDVRLSGYLTDDQVLYMYDYFTTRLAPCLALVGYDIPPAPARDSYLASVRSGVYWNPYFTTSGRAIVASQADMDRLDLQCPGPGSAFWAYRPLAFTHSLNQEGTGGLQ